MQSVGQRDGQTVADGRTQGVGVVRPDLVNVESARADDVRSATAAQGAENLERFISSIVRAAGSEERRPTDGGS